MTFGQANDNGPRPLFGDLTSTSKVTDAIEKKFESVIWHHENVVKSAQHHRLAPGALPHDVLDGIIEHVTAVAKKKNLVPFVTFASDPGQPTVAVGRPALLHGDQRLAQAAGLGAHFTVGSRLLRRYRKIY